MMPDITVAGAARILHYASGESVCRLVKKGELKAFVLDDDEEGWKPLDLTKKESRKWALISSEVKALATQRAAQKAAKKADKPGRAIYTQKMRKQVLSIAKEVMQKEGKIVKTKIRMLMHERYGTSATSDSIYRKIVKILQDEGLSE